MGKLLALEPRPRLPPRVRAIEGAGDRLVEVRMVR
jgi:hypothetical protein